MNKPCRGCRKAVHASRNGKEYWNLTAGCENCEKYRKYQDYLESRRKYRHGKKITTINELIACMDKTNYVYWRHKILHRGFVCSWQLQMILNSLRAGVFYEAVIKGEEE